MKIGVVFPQTEFSNEPQDLKDYAQTVEALGYSHVLAYDHVLGANPDRSGGWKGPYTYQSHFFEPFVLFSFIAAVTQHLELVTGVIILPQRQTALAAKQAATLDVLSGGRVRMGIGLGWNEVEYQSLGEDFHKRGKRIEEQVTLMRLLWTEQLVKFEGRWDKIPDAGLNPLPVQRPIPIWFGGQAEAAIQRAAKLADGWLANVRTTNDAAAIIETIWRLLDENERLRSSFGIEGRLAFGEGNFKELLERVKEWKGIGATHLSINTMGAGFSTTKEHIKALRRFADHIGVSY